VFTRWLAATSTTVLVVSAFIEWAGVLIHRRLVETASGKPPRIGFSVETSLPVLTVDWFLYVLVPTAAPILGVVALVVMFLSVRRWARAAAVLCTVTSTTLVMSCGADLALSDTRAAQTGFWLALAGSLALMLALLFATLERSELR
jgi:hypothetical protein